jgi:hypothetical protein
MNKAELIEAIASQVELSKTKVGQVIDALTETISKTICDGEPVRITGFGTFGPTPAQVQGWGQPADQAAHHSRLAGRASVPS